MGKSLIPPELVHELPMHMRRLHQWYMDASPHGQYMQGVKIRNEDFSHGEDMIWLNFDKLYQLYHQDALDISLISLWLL